jgi:hypothetical protein
MNKTALIISIIVVTLALIPYTISMVMIHRAKKITKKAYLVQIFGVCLDIISTTAMFMIRPGFSFTTHAFFSLGGLALMAIEVVLSTLYLNKKTPRWLLFYTKLDYAYWLFLYLFGSTMLK